MKWRKLIKKTGSYLVEASIIVPVFILAVVLLISMIPITGVCENAVFSVCDEMYVETVKSAVRQNPVALPAMVKHRIIMENPKLTSYENRFYRYLYKDTDADIEDLISLSFRVTVSEKNPMGLFSSVIFDGHVTARAYTGKIFTRPPIPSDEEEDKIVYIFPEWGKCYHSKNCTYVKASCEMVYLSENLKRRCEPCKLCHASQALVGSPVFCFWSSGQVYHVPGCRIVDRYYIEMKKSVCVNKGYVPCSKCGGG